ncbi:MAG TPA: hypothetical protein VL991_12980 [Terracidiphilus sp.]|jgi:hypothetical protein|nr:hypothetical protein [Terracidiphilus sp.]
MPTAVLTAAPIVPASVYVRLKHETNLAAMTQELASLRFSIILLARWEASRAVDQENLAELRDELVHLRELYCEKIDDIAMTFSVQQAIDTKEKVEHAVTVPKNMMPPLKKKEQEQIYF